MGYEYSGIIDHYLVQVNKVGGGAIGKSYDGNWHVRITDSDGNLLLDEVMSTGIHTDHRGVAILALDFLEGEEL